MRTRSNKSKVFKVRSFPFYNYSNLVADHPSGIGSEMCSLRRHASIAIPIDPLSYIAWLFIVRTSGVFIEGRAADREIQMVADDGDVVKAVTHSTNIKAKELKEIKPPFVSLLFLFCSLSRLRVSLSLSSRRERAAIESALNPRARWSKRRAPSINRSAELFPLPTWTRCFSLYPIFLLFLSLFSHLQLLFPAYACGIPRKSIMPFRAARFLTRAANGTVLYS